MATHHEMPPSRRPGRAPSPVARRLCAHYRAIGNALAGMHSGTPAADLRSDRERP